MERVQYEDFDESDHEEEDDDTSFYARLVQEAQTKLALANDTQSTHSTVVNSAAMLEVAWRWHNAICERAQPLTGLYAHCLMLSWAAFCKLFFLVVYENEELYRLIRTHRANQYEYCDRVSVEENVVVSDARLCDYTVQEVWLSLQQIVPSLYRNVFTTHMKTYLYALFFRYCDLQCTRQYDLRRCMDNPLFVKFTREARALDSGSSSEEEDDDDDDEEGGTETESDEEDSEADGELEEYDAYKKTLVPLEDGCSLRAAYFFEGQLAFLSQLKRVLLSETLVSLAQQAPLRLAHPLSAPILVECTRALTQMVDSLFQHRLLKQYIKEEFRRRVLSLYVYHGETERFRARWPHANNSPADVLALLRPGDNEAAMKVLKMTAHELLADTQRYERELVLMTKCATRQWLASETGDEALAERIDKCFLMEEMATLRTIDQHVAGLAVRVAARLREEDVQDDEPHPVPLLLRLVRQYYVARRVTGELYSAGSFTEAYLLWLKLLVIDGHLRRSHMHTDIRVHMSRSADDAFIQLAYETHASRLAAQGHALNQFVALAQDTRGASQQRVTNAVDQFVDMAYVIRKRRQRDCEESESVTEAEETEETEEMESEDPVQYSTEECEDESSECEEQDLVERVDNATMRELQRFYTHDLASDLCSRRRFDQIFARPHYVQWWYKQEFPLRAIGRLNSEPYIRELRRLLWQAHEQLLLFGFCGFFIERDIDQWLLEQDQQSEETGALPFCVIELGENEDRAHGSFKRRRRVGQVRYTMEFHCTKRAMRERYDCWVYEPRARFETLSKRQAEACETDEGAVLVPLSPFFALYTEKLRVLETSVAQHDANAQSTHPEHVVYTKLLEEPPLEDLPRDFTYALDDLDRGKQIAATKRQNATVATASAHLKRMSSGRVGGGDDSDEDGGCDERMVQWGAYLDEDDADTQRRDACNPFKQRLREFGRPSLVNMLTKPLPPSMQIERGPAPHILLRAEELQRQYETNVCNLTDCSPSLLRPHGGESSVEGSRFQQNADAQLRATFEFLFGELYRRSFGRLDSSLFASMGAEGITARLKFEQIHDI